MSLTHSVQRVPFGNRSLRSISPWSHLAHVQGCRLHLRGGDRVFTFTGDAILEWNESNGGWRFVYVTGETNIQPYRWSMGTLMESCTFVIPSWGFWPMWSTKITAPR